MNNFWHRSGNDRLEAYLDLTYYNFIQRLKSSFAVVASQFGDWSWAAQFPSFKATCRVVSLNFIHSSACHRIQITNTTLNNSTLKVDWDRKVSIALLGCMVTWKGLWSSLQVWCRCTFAAIALFLSGQGFWFLYLPQWLYRFNFPSSPCFKTLLHHWQVNLCLSPVW